MRITVGRTLIVLGLVAAAATVVWMLIPGRIPVEVVSVKKARFVASVNEDGKTRIRERYVVAAPLAGRLGRVRFKVGDPIGVDDVVATIMPSPVPLLDQRSRREAEERLGAAEAALERAKAGVERAVAQNDQAKNDLARTRTLVERGATTVQALERADLVMRLADRDLRAAEFQNHAAEHELNQTQAVLASVSRWCRLAARKLEPDCAGCRRRAESCSGKRNHRPTRGAIAGDWGPSRS